jgi:uncharacterized SAM-binding protein YcdF (DUF218 family)
MDVLYQIVKHLTLPLSFILGLLLTGFSLVLVRWRRLGLVVLSVSILLLYVLSIAPTADRLLQPLESNYLPLSPESLPKVGTLVVLGGGIAATTSAPESSRLYTSSVKRLLEAIRLYHLMEQAQIVVSGGSGNPFVEDSEAVAMRDLLTSLGVPDDRVVVEDGSRNTFENARAIQGLQLKQPLILITSARHMVRALKVFNSLGIDPLPAPCDYRVSGSVEDPLRFFPSAGSLDASTGAIYEYLGIWWYKLRRRL